MKINTIVQPSHLLVTPIIFLFPLLCLIILFSFFLNAAPGINIAENSAMLMHDSRETQGINYATDRLIVQFQDDALVDSKQLQTLNLSDTSFVHLLSNYGVRHITPLFPEVKNQNQTHTLSQIYVLHLEPGHSVLNAVTAFASHPLVAWAEPDYVAYDAAVPSDVLYPNQWALAQIQADAAWDVVTGTSNTLIAVLDTGVDITHPDLADRIWVNPGETPNNGLDDDGNNLIDDVNGWNYIAGTNDVFDDDGHGTTVAGIAAADTNNSVGIAGMCWNCRLMPLKVMQTGGVANYSDVALGIYYAINKGADVINISLGGYADSLTLRAAIEKAAETAVIVAAAGDDGSDVLFYPAAYQEVIAVGGTTDTDARDPDSNYGSWVDLAAPSIALDTTVNGGGYGQTSGTSGAAALVSGLVGLIWSQHPDWSPDMVRAQVIYTAEPIGVTGVGNGRINAMAAVMQTPHPLLAMTSLKIDGDPLGRPTPGTMVDLAITLDNLWLAATGVRGVLSTPETAVTLIENTALYGDLPSGANAIGTPHYQVSIDEAVGYNAPLRFDLTLTANDATYTVTLPFTITTRTAEESVGGTIMADTIWTNDKTYVVNNNVGVAPGVTLTIQAGTSVKFNGPYRLNVGGTLIAAGSQAQPIRFLSHGSATWDQIYFDDSSPDATASANGTYQTGSVLKWVEIDNTSTGIRCQNSTPFLSHVTLNSGNINCTTGETPLWLQDSYSLSSVMITGKAQVWRNTIMNGGVTVSGDAVVQDNNVIGPLSTGTASQIVGNTLWWSSINAPGASTVNDNEIFGGTVFVGNNAIVHDNQVRGGSIAAGNFASVLTNTIYDGDIVIGDSSTVSRNTIQAAPGWAITASGTVTVTHNRVIGGANGISMVTGLLQNNLVANNAGTGVQVGTTSVLNNSIINNKGSALVIASGTPIIQDNNLDGNTGSYDIVNNTANSIAVAQNWWGITDEAAIPTRIYDIFDDYNLGQVTFTPILATPIQTAPAYVRAVTLTPQSPIGIESVVAEVLFSRPMDISVIPDMVYHNSRKGIWESVTTANSNIGSDDLCGDSLMDSQGQLWLGSGRVWPTSPGVANVFCNGPLSLLHLDETWEVIPDGYHNKLIEDADGNVLYDLSIAIDPNNGDIWRGHAWNTPSLRVTHADNTVDSFTTANSDLISDQVWALALDPNNSSLWIGTWEGLSLRRANGEWESHLPGQKVVTLAVDEQGGVWAGTYSNGVWFKAADSDSWQLHRAGGYGLHSAFTTDIEIDSAGNVWFAHGRYGGGGSVYYTDGSWEQFTGPIWSISVADDGTAYFSKEDAGLSIRRGGYDYPIGENGHWVAADRWQASFDVTGIIPQDVYSITIRGAADLDDFTIAPDATHTFTVDYIGTPETEPPPVPDVQACASSTTTTLSGKWSVATNQSISLYRYAIGTGPGLDDVTSWVTTTLTAVTRNNLNLLAGETYIISVQARNTGDIWSEISSSNPVVAGAGGCPEVAFNATPITGMAPLAVSFTAQLTDTVTSQLWTLAENVTSTLATPVYTYTTPGNYTITLEVTGPGGATTLVKENYIVVTPDTEPPTGTLTINNGAAYVNTSAVSLDLIAEDASGLDAVQFSNDGVSYVQWMPYERFHSWTLTPGDGEKSVYVQIRDLPGNVQTITDKILLDTTAPIAVVTPLATFVDSTTFAVSWSGSDGDGVGVASFDVQVRQGTGGAWTDWLPESLETTALFTGEHGQTYYFRTRARDTLGNLGAYASGDGDAATTVDLLPPVGSLEINGGATYASSTGATLTLSATDLSGVTAFQLSNDGELFTDWIDYAQTYPWMLTAVDGEKIVFVRYRDQLGHNSIVYSDTIVLDTTPPVGLVVIENGDGPITTTIVTLKLTAIDANSGVTQMQFSNDGSSWGNWEPYADTKVWSLGNENGLRTVYGRYQDLVGNQATFSDTVLLDNTAPVAMVEMLTPYQTNLDFPVTWSGTDAFAEIDSFDIQVRIGDGTWSDWITHTTAISATFSGLNGYTYSFRARAQDSLGNRGEFRDGSGDTTTHVDTTRPEGNVIINGGALETISPEVALVLTANGASHISFSDNGIFFTPWQPYFYTRSIQSYQLPDTNGSHIVYVRYRDLSGNTVVYNDSIILNNSMTGDTGVSINNDASVTDQITVTLSVKAPPGTQSMQISNSSRFVGADWEPYQTSQTWTLAYHPDAAIYQVYVKFRHVDGTISERYDDLITLHLNTPPPPIDSTPPSGSMVINAGTEESTTPLVTLDMLASDNAGGVGVQWMYFREWKYDPLTVQWITVQSSGWMPYAESTTWELSSGSGVKYIGAWFADGANNVSNPVIIDNINLLPNNDDIGASEVTQYRQSFEPGETVTITLSMSAGDADLYIWSPNSEAVPDYWSNQGGMATEQIVFTAVDGEYLIEVHGYTNAAYTLDITGSNSAPAQQSRFDFTMSNFALAVTGKSLPAKPLMVTQPGTAQQPEGEPQFQLFLPFVINN